MVKLISFDIDDTLALIDKPASEEAVQFLKDAEHAGIRIVFNSGRHLDYMTGFVRQIGLSRPIICAESGAFIQYGATCPPSKNISMVDTTWDTSKFTLLMSALQKRFGSGIWFENKVIIITARLKSTEARNEAVSFTRHYLREHSLETSSVVLHSPGCLDVIPTHINKGIALARVMEIERIQKPDVIAIGNGPADIYAFSVAGTAVGIGGLPAQHEFPTIEKALPFLRGIVALGRRTDN